MKEPSTTPIPLNNAESRPAMLGFESSAADVGHIATMAGSASAVAREEAELKTAIVLARSNPRNELACFARIIRSCQRPSFANDAAYKYPRGNKTVTGPSVYLAREMARIWGNIRSGIRIVSVDREYVHIKGYCHDLESNAYKESEAKFKPLQQRIDRSTGETRWVQPDERDLRELINKHGAICERNSILQTLPSDFIEDALAESAKTLVDFGRKELRENQADVLKRLVMTFSTIGVTAEMLVGYLGHPLEQVVAEELADLRQIYQSIRDGNSSREEYFALRVPNADPSKLASESAVERVAQRVQAIREANQSAATNQAATVPAAPAGSEPADRSGGLEAVQDADPAAAGDGVSMFGESRARQRTRRP